jgi:hypothetical protein
VPLVPRPINADVPAERPTPAEPAKSPASAPKPPKRPKRRREPIPAALKAICGLFLLALVFIVAAILGGGGEDGSGSAGTPAPLGQSGADDSNDASAGQTAGELGYPAFATANTTRVGGADPAPNAAAVALAAYPSAKSSQRPPAVVLANEDDWQGAIAASVLMAPPIGAPVLISARDGLPDPTAEALDALDPRGSKDTKGAAAFVIGGASSPSGLPARRIGPGGGAAAAAAIASLREELVGRPPDHIVVAPTANPEFAMPAAAWAARSGDPVLFSDADSLPAATAKALEAHPKAHVYVLGPSSAISSKALREIAKAGGPVRRVSGEDPVANAVAFARYADGDFGWGIVDPGHGFVVARSEDPLEAAAAAALSASGAWGPLLLTDSADTLPAALHGYLLDVKPGYTTDPTRAFYNHVWTIGDEEAIGVSEQAEMDELAALARIGGEG